MSLFSAARGLWWVASEVVDAAKQLVAFTPGQDEESPKNERCAREAGSSFPVKHGPGSPHLRRESIAAGATLTPDEAAERLAEYEAGVECLEAQDDCGLGGGDVEPPTLVRFWVDGYPITAFVDDWDDGRFTITASHPFSAVVRSKISQAPLTVYSTDELEWVVDTVTTDRTSYGPEYTVTCKPRMDVLRKSLISDDYLCWLWLDAEKRHAECTAAAPGFSGPVEAADNDPGVSHSPTPGSQTSSEPSEERPAPAVEEGTASSSSPSLDGPLGGASDSRSLNISGAGHLTSLTADEVYMAAVGAHWYAESALDVRWSAYRDLGYKLHDIASQMPSLTLGNDPAAVHDRAMRQRHNEDRP